MKMLHHPRINESVTRPTHKWKCYVTHASMKVLRHTRILMKVFRHPRINESVIRKFGFLSFIRQWYDLEKLVKLFLLMWYRREKKKEISQACPKGILYYLLSISSYLMYIWYYRTWLSKIVQSSYFILFPWLYLLNRGNVVELCT